MQLTDELRQHGLTLFNYASIREQSIGGFIQVGELSFGVQQKRAGQNWQHAVHMFCGGTASS